MSNVRRFEDEPARMLRAMSGSRCISFGTDAPHATLGRVGFRFVGYAQYARVGFDTYALARDTSALVPIARQHIMRACSEAGLDLAGLDLLIHTSASTREFVRQDVNATSKTSGRRRRFVRVSFALDVLAGWVGPYRAKLPSVYFQ